jgi:curved DNA-binding protein CbpA
VPAPARAATPLPRPPGASVPIARPPPAPAPKPAGPGPLDPAALRATFERVQSGDHFQALGLKRDAAAAQIKVAYFQLAKVYHPDAVSAAAPAEVKKLCADVFARVSEAWGVLGDDASRAAYVQELASGEGKPDVDVMAILQAESTFQAATVLVRGRRYDEALGKLAEAMKLNPDEPEFGMWKAWCEFLVAGDKAGQQPASARSIEALLRKNPKCAQGYLFLGQMAKLVGDAAQAERHWKRGLVVAPEHADIQRELKYLRK